MAIMAHQMTSFLPLSLRQTRRGGGGEKGEFSLVTLKAQKVPPATYPTSTSTTVYIFHALIWPPLESLFPGSRPTSNNSINFLQLPTTSEETIDLSLPPPNEF